MKLKTHFIIFACLYAWIYMLPAPLNEIPGLSMLFKPYKDALEILTLWFGKNILGLSTLEKIKLAASGDTTFDYVLVLVKLLLAFLISFGAIWWLREEKRFEHFRFWTRTAVRWYLGLFMMVYGGAKVVPNGQFMSPGLFDLDERYGDFSPMGLLWRFMGFSFAYKFKADSLLTSFTLTQPGDSAQQFVFVLEQDSNVFKINGLWKGDTLRAALHRVDESKLQLMSRGFHWINESPFNR